MQPIWGFQSKLRVGKTSNHIAMKKQDGAEFQGLPETLKRWGEWKQECFRKDKAHLEPQIERIPETERGK